MKRFYCTICKKVKRVRNLPSNVQTRTSEVVTERIGQCNRHISIGQRLHTLSRKVGGR